MQPRSALRSMVGSSLFSVGVLIGAGGIARADTAPPPPLQAQPAPPPPQGAFPPPPPRAEAAPPPWTATNVAAQSDGGDQGVRPLTLTAAVGSGLLVGPGEQALALSYLVRAGVALDPHLALVLSYGSVGTSSVNPATQMDSWLKQDSWSLGLQGLPLPGIYLRGGLGVGMVSESVNGRTFSGGRGLAVEAAVGHELLQRQHVAVALELNGTYTHYPRESWKTAGLQLTVSLF